ncbi:MAG: Nif3-like dinuclear metal center hexameric protein [Bacillota bacterium]|jgi:dinuclear metal center YbgI/SA1388 family protein
MKVYDVVKAVEKIAPPELCAAWDNSGFLVGDENADVQKAYICLDVVHSTVDDAVKNGCNLIVAHHPVLFSGIKKITADDPTGSVLLKLIGNKINVVAAHTNFDSSEMGVNYVLATAMGLSSIKKMNDEPDNPSYIGSFDNCLTGWELAEKIKSVLGINIVRAAGLDLQKKYKTVAVCGGSGTDLWSSALQAGAEALISADGKHHVGLEAEAAGIAVFDGGHFHTENISMKYLERYLNDILPDLPTVLSKIDTCPWKNY